MSCALGVLLLSARADAVNVVYLVGPGTSLEARQQVATAVHFYGLGLTTEVLTGPTAVAHAISAIGRPEAVAVVIDAEVLASLDRNLVFAATRRRKAAVPLLVNGINSRTSSTALRLWSGSAVSASRPLATASNGWELVRSSNEITRQLGGALLPLELPPVNSLEMAGKATFQELIAVKLTAQSWPVFVRTSQGGQDLFFFSEFRAPPLVISPDPFRQQAVFAAIAPIMLFVRHAAADHAWHSSATYANFTIDDLWLREPYGHVNYQKLLEQAQRHNFHTTIAFIPWNFDRSEPEVVALFRGHPERLSLAIHGNDHVHQEFGPLESHPLAEQERNIAQSLVRMRRFHQLTGLAYDPVMIFPHSVSPAATFAALRQANFLGTVNSLNVPSDQSAPPDAEFAMRSVTLDFADFPSVRRYSVESEVARSQLAIDAFLGNPMLFYAHESFFAAGDTAFNPIADEVNQLQPGVHWASLGEIMRHLYLQRLRDDGDIDIRSLSPSILLENDDQRPVRFRIEKEESSRTPVTVLVDSQPVPFERGATQLRLSLSIPAGSKRLIEVRYGGPVALSETDLKSHSITTGVIRALSDFRDNTVSRTSLGRQFIRSYAVSGAIWNRVVMVVIAFMGVLAFVWRYQAGTRQSLLARFKQGPSLR